MNLFQGVAELFAKAIGDMTRIRESKREKIKDRKTAANAAAQTGSQKWRCSLTDKTVMANTKSEARARFKAILNGKEPNWRRYCRLPARTVVKQVV
jgi:hypothetical protein